MCQRFLFCLFNTISGRRNCIFNSMCSLFSQGGIQEWINRYRESGRSPICPNCRHDLSVETNNIERQLQLYAEQENIRNIEELPGVPGSGQYNLNLSEDDLQRRINLLRNYTSNNDDYVKCVEERDICLGRVRQLEERIKHLEEELSSREIQNILRNHVQPTSLTPSPGFNNDIYDLLPFSDSFSLFRRIKEMERQFLRYFYIPSFNINETLPIEVRINALETALEEIPAPTFRREYGSVESRLSHIERYFSRL